MEILEKNVVTSFLSTNLTETTDINRTTDFKLILIHDRQGDDMTHPLFKN